MPYTGALSLWLVEQKNGYSLSKLWDYHPDYKVQSACFHQDKLLVYGSDRLEIFDIDLSLQKTIRIPGMAGGHTVSSEENGNVWVTSAPSNALFRLDLEAGTVVERLPMPAIYGTGYEIGEDFDPLEHYIPTNLQPTHVNSAVPVNNGLLVTTWIQGAVGFFDIERNYRELIRGFTGCHGARIDPDSGHVFLSDSPTGLVWFVDFETGAIRGRFETGSKWLHDADTLGNGVFACTLGDSNELVLVQAKNGSVLTRKRCDELGASTMLINACIPDVSWNDCLKRLTEDIKDREPSAVTTSGHIVAALPDILPCWFSDKQHISLGLHTASPVEYEYLFKSNLAPLPAGTYTIEATAAIHQGAMTIGVVRTDTQNWLATINLDKVLPAGKAQFVLDQDTPCVIVASAFNTDASEVVEGVIQLLTLTSHAPTVQQDQPLFDPRTELKQCRWTIKDKLHTIAVLEDKLAITIAERDHALAVLKEQHSIAIAERDHAAEIRDNALAELHRMQDDYRELHNKFHCAKALFKQLLAVLLRRC